MIATRAKIYSPILGLAAFFPAPANAHHLIEFATPTNFASGLLSGMGHPILGLDHLAFLILMALLAAAAKKPLALPASFFALSAIGLAAGLEGFSSVYVEILVALSIIFGGLALYQRRFAYAICGFGFFHGVALTEGIAGAGPIPLLGYLMGLGVVEYGLVTAGAFALMRAENLGRRAEKRFACAFGLVGGLFLFLF